MSLFCIPPNLVDKLKNSDGLKTDTDIAKLKEMSSKEREKFFADRTNAELGKFLNTKFEAAVISTQKTALLDWAKSTFKPVTKLDQYQARLDKLKSLDNPTAQDMAIIKRLERIVNKNDTYTRVRSRINELDDLGILDEAGKSQMFQDIASERLGITVSADEIAKIHRLSRKIDEAETKVSGHVGDPTKFSENMEFFKAKKEMDDYLAGLTPQSKLRIATGTIGRGMMLFSVKSPVLNIGSNFEIGLSEKLTRLATIRSKSASKDLAKQYRVLVNKVYNATGYDLTRMTHLGDTGASGERVLSDVVHAQGKGKLRATGRIVEDIVFKNLMGKPDVMFAAHHFADSAGRLATKMSKGNKARAKEFMADAMRIEPQTPEGLIIREQSILDAQVATWTNKSWASDASLSIRKILNKLSGDLRLGDYFMPFVKTPANVIATGVDYAGFGLLKGGIKGAVYAVNKIRKGEVPSKEALRGMGRDMFRGGMGLTGAVILASQFKEEDFVGAYDPYRKQIDQLRNSNENSVKIGDTWVSLDWFGPLAIPMTAMLYAKKYGNGVYGYVQGGISGVMGLPGIEDIAQVYDDWNSRGRKQGATEQELLEDAGKFVSSELASRAIPSWVADIGNSYDSNALC